MYNSKNTYRNDFVWMPISDLKARKKLSTKNHDVSSVKMGVYDYVNSYWDNFLQSQSIQKGSGTYPVSVPVVPQSFFMRWLYDLKKWLLSLLPSLSGSSKIGYQSTPLSRGEQKLSNWLNLENAIYFYDRDQQYYEFTNFYELNPHMIIDRKTWKTSEHYFQGQKFINYPQMLEAVRTSNTPRDAFNYAQANFQLSMRPNWLTKDKFDVMLTALREKFKNPGLKNLLLKTGDKILVEASPVDAIWGYEDRNKGIAKGSGQNHLGRMLMHVREELRTGQQKIYNP